MTAIISFSHRATSILVLICALPQLAADDTNSIQSQLNAVKQQQMAAQKQFTLKKAAVDVAKKRVADLQMELKTFQERVAAESKALEVAKKNQAARNKEVDALAAQLKKHQQADTLVAAAAAAKKAVTAATQKHADLTAQVAATVKGLAMQKKRQTDAAAALKAAQETLPKKVEELKVARTSYDSLGKEVDKARLAVNRAREAVKAKETGVPLEKSRLQKANAALAQANASINSLQQSLAALKAAATATGTDPKAAGSELTTSITVVSALRTRAEGLVKSASGNVTAAEKQVADAEADLKVAQERLREHQNKYAAQSQIHFRLQLAVADLQNAPKLHESHIADAKSQQEQLTAKQTELTEQTAVAAEEIEKAESAFMAKQSVAEKELETLGRFVSFSQHIAPIFAKRCIACHNTRTASGRLNMDSFAALLKGGESGAAIEKHNSEDSLLSAVIEDGSMPKDADPLEKEEIALIRKWIDVGAPLDVGIVATAELFEVIPEIQQPLPPKTYRVPIPVTATAFNKDASILASSGYHEILLWNTADGKLLRRITNVAERVYDLEFNADGSQLAVAAGTPGQLGEVKLFSTSDGKHQKTLVRTKDAIFAVAYSPDGKQVAAGGADRVVYAIDISSGKTNLRIEDHGDWVMDVNWSPDGKQLVSASRDKSAKVIDVASGNSLSTFSGHGNAVYSAAFLNDGKSIVSAGSDRQARVWNPVDAKEIRKIGGFGSDIFRVTVTPDNHLLTASGDRNAREHNLADGKVIRTFAGHKDWVYTLCYNASRKLLATGSYDGEIRVWNSENGSVATSFIAVPKAGDSATVATAEK